MLLALVAWIAFFGFYLLFAGQTSLPEIIAGAPAATFVACFTVLLHRAEERRFRFRAPWARVLVQPLAGLLPDALRVGRVLLRVLWRRPSGPVGVLARQPFRQGGDDPSDAARRGIVTLCGSLAPNGYVLAIPEGEDSLVLHHLAPVPPAADREWPL